MSESKKDEVTQGESTTQDSSGSFEETPHHDEATPQDKKPMGVTRRNLLIGIGGAVALLALGGGAKYLQQTPLIRPPGGQDEDRVISSCIRCERCYEACPRKVIVPAHLEDGLPGMRTPTLDFSSDFCDYCTEENGGTPLCVKVCPTNSLVLPEDATALNVIIGKAVIDTYSCLAYRETGCRTCYDNCPYEAISLDTRDGARYPLPIVDLDLCNGCGACESTCISLESGSVAATHATEVAITIKTLDSLE